MSPFPAVRMNLGVGRSDCRVGGRRERGDWDIYRFGGEAVVVEG